MNAKPQECLSEESKSHFRGILTAWATDLSDSEVETIQNSVVDWPDSTWAAWVKKRERIAARYGIADKQTLDYAAFAMLTASGPFARPQGAEA